jgi:hypothetical protein
MNPALKDVWKHIADLGLGALAHANRHAAYAAIENAKWPELSVIQASHAAELLIKARIAQEHPLLIFEQLPKSTQAAGEHLALKDLFEKGRTLQWNELPERLWATTGTTLPNVDKFQEFGRLRNGIQHFGVTTGVEPGGLTLQFIFQVIDPFINREWDLFAVDRDEDTEPYVYFVGALVSREIEFLVSPEAAEQFDDWDVDWSDVSKEYRELMHTRVKEAVATKKKASPKDSD